MRTYWLALTTGTVLAVIAGCGAAPRPAPPTVSGTPTRASMPPAAAPTPVWQPPQSPAEAALLRVVSKQAPLGGAFRPDELVTLPPEAGAPGLGALQLTAPAAQALLEMQAAARASGFDLRVQSAYRSFEQQREVHAALAARVGAAEALRRSAPAGASEHQLGTTVDLTSASVGWGLNARFASTPEGRWLAAHAHQSGFALSYPEGAEAVTGYVYEPWHFRYIGVARAAAWHASSLPLVEYLERVAAAAR